MSILIKGLNMPKDDCEAYRELIITNNYVGNGKIQMLAHDSNTNEFIGKVVEVPEPHGRLIDADRLINELAKAIPYAIVSPTDETYVEGLSRAKIETEDAPTVIEAEGEDNERID